MAINSMMARVISAQIISVLRAILFAMLMGNNVALAGSPVDLPPVGLPPAVEPVLTEPGYWEADFNEALIACYQGSMAACDAIWLNNRVLLDSLLSQYGQTCGGRVDIRMTRNLLCTEIFPGNE